jgi:hypothetical protein
MQYQEVFEKQFRFLFLFMCAESLFGGPITLFISAVTNEHKRISAGNVKVVTNDAQIRVQ